LGHLPHPKFSKHCNFDIYRNFQRIKMKFSILIIFKKSYLNFSLSCSLICLASRFSTVVAYTSGTRCFYENTNIYCPDCSVCILIKTEKFSFSEMLRRELLSVCQACAESHGIIFNYSKTVCMTFKAKSAKSTVTPLLTHGW